MRLMRLGVFKRHVALLKSSCGVRQVPWAALWQLLSVTGAQHQGQSCWVASEISEGSESMGLEMNVQSAAIRARFERLFKPQLLFTPRAWKDGLSAGRDTGNNRELGYPCFVYPTPSFYPQQRLC